MLGFLSTIINLIRFISDVIFEYVDKFAHYMGEFFELLYQLWSTCQNFLPLPVQAVAGVILSVMLARLIISLGRR